MFRRFFKLLLTSFAVGCFYQNPVDAFRVLVSAPNLMHSHMALHISIADMLAEQGGHEVTLLIQQWNPDNNFPPPPEQENHTRWTRSQRVIQHSVSGRDRQKQRQLIKAMPFFQSDIWASDYVNFFHAGLKPMMTEMLTTSCKGLLQDSHLLVTLRQLHFDVAIGEWFDGCTLALFRLLNIPTTMLTSAIPMSSAMAQDLGIPTPIYVPDVNFAPPEGTAMGVWQRAWNLYRRHQEMQDMRNVFNWDAIIEPLVGPGLLPSNRQLLLDSSFVLINTNEYLDLATPTSAKVKHIGGFALDRSMVPRKLSPEMEGLLLDADNGAVLVSFGSLADPRQMPAKMLAAFLDAFAAFPEHKFIWKFKEDAEEASSSNHSSAATSLSQVQPKFPANVRRFDWVDQQALLAHPKLRLFISHCGLNSLNEAVVEAVPLLCIPIFGDQTYNTAIVNQRRIGRALLKSQLNVPNLRHALEELLAEGNQYAKNMRTTSRKMALAPFQPQEVLLRHVEFAAEFHGQFDELNLEAARMSTLALWGLDFMVPLALAAASLSALLARICWLLTVRMSRTVAKAKLE